jgi:hypothetical protein
VGVW